MNIEEFETKLYNLLINHLQGLYNIEEYLELLEVEPYNSLLLYVTSNAYFCLDNNEKAKEFLEKAKTSNSNIDFDENYENLFIVIYYIFSTITTKLNPYCDDEIETLVNENSSSEDLLSATKKYISINDCSNSNRVSDIALTKYPNEIKFQVSKSIALLKTRNISKAWECCEKYLDCIRESCKDYINKPKFNLQKNYGNIYVYSTQGFGDTIFFSRYIIELQKQYPKLNFIVNCGKNLKDLLSYNGFKAIENKPERSSIDYQLSLEGVAYLCRDFDCKNYAKGYLKANKQLSEELKEKYFNNNKLKVGIVWNSSEETSQRNINLNMFSELLKNPNIQCYSLQLKSSIQEQVILAQNSVVSLGEKISDFSTTASFIDNLDLVVGCDTSVTNLSGAMGKKTYVILPYEADFRWGLYEQYSTMFNSVEMFRAKQKGTYEEVFERINDKIRTDN